MYPVDYVSDVRPTLKWSTLLPREDYRGIRASISRRLDYLEKCIGGHVPSPKEIVQMCDDPLESTSDHEVLTGLETTVQTTLLLLIHASINTGYIGWLKDKSLHYRLRLLDDPAPHLELNDDARQLRREIYSSTITTLEKAIASTRRIHATFMAKPFECLAHGEPTKAAWEVGRQCKVSDSVMMRKLFYIATAYTVTSPRNHNNSSDRCKVTECSHIDCQYQYTQGKVENNPFQWKRCDKFEF